MNFDVVLKIYDKDQKSTSCRTLYRNLTLDQLNEEKSRMRLSIYYFVRAMMKHYPEGHYRMITDFSFENEEISSRLCFEECNPERPEDYDEISCCSIGGNNDRKEI